MQAPGNTQIPAAIAELQQSCTSPICYLVPTKWWKQFCLLNASAHRSSKTKEEILMPSTGPALEKYIDSFLLDYKDSIINQLQHKSNYLKLNNLAISPQICQQFNAPINALPFNFKNSGGLGNNQNLKNQDWTYVSSDIWKLICKKYKYKFGIMRLCESRESGAANAKNGHSDYQKQGQQLLQSAQLPPQTQIQIQIIFCSKAKSEAFVGFFSDRCNIAHTIRSIGYQLGFIEMNNSRIIYPDKNPQKPYYYFQLQPFSFLQGQDTFFMAYNLETIQNEESRNGKAGTGDFSFGGEGELGNSNQAVAGDMAIIGLESFQQVRNDGTVSTGAETPSFFGSQDENRTGFRVRQLFREKKPEQISQLRIKAKKIIGGKLIPVVQKSDEQLQISLEGVAQELMQHIHSHKKKSYKDKQVYNE